MLHEWGVGGELFALLTGWDAMIAATVAAEGCRHCGGPLYQSNYCRKPRGALLAVEGEAFALRHSLCCGREGCRRRTLPPSLRFLGRRVYLEIVVVLAGMWAMIVETTVAEAAVDTGVPRTTLSRWGRWWSTLFPGSSAWAELKARFVPPAPADAELPRALVERIEREMIAEPCRSASRRIAAIVLTLARHLAPITTSSCPRGSRYLRGIADRMQVYLRAQKM